MNVQYDNQQTGLILAIPPHVMRLKVGGLDVTLRLTRQFKNAGVQGPVVWVVYKEEKASFIKEGIELVPFNRLSECLNSKTVKRWVFASGDLVFSGDGLKEAIKADGFSSFGFGVADFPSYTKLINWVEGVCLLKKQEPPTVGEIKMPHQRYFGYAKGPKEAKYLHTQILKHVARKQDPNFARFTKRRFSNPLSVIFVQLGLSPNMVTACAILSGVAGALMVMQMTYLWSIAGAMCLIISRILDDCDGAVARLSFRASRIGAIFDIAGDIIVYTTLFVALGFSLYWQNPYGHHLWAMALLLFGAAVTTVIILWFVTDTKIREESPLIATLERTASGDVAYFFFPFALIDAHEVFLWSAAIGSQIYWMIISASVFMYKHSKSKNR
ncbi:MAG: CDP-alcohol phosphatidyltransferase family protein [Candidatus Magnetoovum sp. WYHC-5]|nr:CDP-alcohol phosphatidyltransferase family protein [Candidatus Magnetoovum sp. WYHC-5]